MHYKEAKTILSSKGGMNLYRGCVHGCIYCDSRSLCYGMDHVFEDIEVKSNAIELLEDTLNRKRKKCMIGTGSMTDPYIPLEKELGHVRKAMELALKYGFGFTLITKSDLVLRDIDLLKAINDQTKAVVQMTLTTYDEDLCRKLEPKVSTTRERFEALLRLKEAGIPTVVWLCPILPFINDTEENLRGILNYCEEAEVRGIINFGIGMTLREGSRDHYYKELDRLFPGLKERYIKTYGNGYILTSPENKRLMPIFYDFCEKRGIISEPDEVFSYLWKFEDKTAERQLRLF